MGILAQMDRYSSILILIMTARHNFTINVTSKVEWEKICKVFKTRLEMNSASSLLLSSNLNVVLMSFLSFKCAGSTSRIRKEK